MSIFKKAVEKIDKKAEEIIEPIVERAVGPKPENPPKGGAK